MRRITVFLLSVVMVLGTILLGGRPIAMAQEATPQGEEEGLEGISLEFLGGGETETLPSAPVSVILVRVGLAPGAAFPADANDPSIAVITVEAGVVTMNVEAPMTVLHLPANAEPGPEDFEQYAAGQEFTMEVGDSTLFPANVGGEIRNDGEEDAILLGTIIEPSGGSQATPEA